MSLRSSVEEFDADRETVELIWFPTGGGKTEAYLGLTAFSLFMRRLKDDLSSLVDFMYKSNCIPWFSEFMRYDLKKWIFFGKARKMPGGKNGYYLIKFKLLIIFMRSEELARVTEKYRLTIIT